MLVTDQGLLALITRESNNIIFLKILAPFLIYFRSFHIPIKMKIYKLNYIGKLKKFRCCAWDSNPEPQDGRRWRFHDVRIQSSSNIKIDCQLNWKDGNKEKEAMKGTFL